MAEVTPELVVDDAPPYDDEPPPDDRGLDLALIRRYKDLREAQRISEAEGTAYKQEADALQDQLVDMFADAGLQNVSIDGKTVYLHRSVFARRLEGKTEEDVHAALIADGAGDLIQAKVNAQTLAAYVRELTEDDDAPGLPEHVREVIEPFEKFAIRINAAGSRSKSKTHSK